MPLNCVKCAETSVAVGNRSCVRYALRTSTIVTAKPSAHAWRASGAASGPAPKTTRLGAGVLTSKNRSALPTRSAPECGKASRSRARARARASGVSAELVSSPTGSPLERTSSRPDAPPSGVTRTAASSRSRASSHARVAASRSRSSSRSMRTSTAPLQPMPSPHRESSSRSYLTMTGSPVVMTRTAASATDGSRHPPERAHSYVPSARTSMRVPSRRYALPRTRTIVATAVGSPEERASRIALRKRSISRRSIGSRSHRGRERDKKGRGQRANRAQGTGQRQRARRQRARCTMRPM